MQTTMRSTPIHKKERTAVFEIKPGKSLSHSLWAGAVSGQVAGLVAATVLMAAFGLFMGRSPFYPVQIIGSAVFGERAFVGQPFGPIFVGLLIHLLGPSLFWGVVYGFIASKIKLRSNEDALTLGGAVGLAAMIVDVYFLMPLFMRLTHDTNFWAREMPPFWDWATHLIYGFSLGVFPYVFKKLYGLSAGSYRLPEESVR